MAIRKLRHFVEQIAELVDTKANEAGLSKELRNS